MRRSALFMVFVCLVLIFFGVVYVIKIKYTLKGMSYYCFCVQSESNESGAHEKSIEVIEKGGAGYVYEKNGVYHVVASVYTEEKNAEVVAEKNGGYVLKISIPSLTFYDKTQANSTAKTYGSIFTHAHTLIDVFTRYDGYLCAKTEVLSFIDKYENSVRSYEDGFFSGLDLTFESEDVSVKAKYYACDLIFSAHKYFT